jgi:hypothetical protein
MLFFVLLFLGLCGLCGALMYNNNSNTTRCSGNAATTTSGTPPPPSEDRDALHSFRRKYLVVYGLAVLADWLQGPYVYALYEGYGFSRGAIAGFFIVGFGSSLFFGTFVGSLADKL